MYRTLALAALLAVSATTASAQPTASLSSGFTFVDWLSTGRSETVGTGDVDTRNVVFYVKEKAVGGLQSWYIFFDPFLLQSVRGSITFESSIVQLITTRDGLESSEAMYGLTDQIDYGYRRATGLEWPDAVTYSGNELDFRLTAIDPGDHMRVLTQAVPEPSSLAMLAFGLSAMGVAARRRRRV